MNQMENKTKLQYNNHSWIPFIFFYMCIASNVSSIIIILFKINKKIKRTRKNLGLLKGRTNVWLFDQSCMLVSGNLSNKFDSDVCCSNHCWFSILVLKFCTICIIQLFHFFLLGILLFILLLFKKKKKKAKKQNNSSKETTYPLSSSCISSQKHPRSNCWFTLPMSTLHTSSLYSVHAGLLTWI